MTAAPSGQPAAPPLAPAAKEPSFVLIYGSSGAGKTTACGRAFPNALYLAAPGALASIRSTLGYDVAAVDATKVRTIRDAIKYVEEVGRTKRFDCVVLDDLSQFAEQTFSLLEKNNSGFKLWGLLRDVVLDFRDAARYAGVHVVCSAWEQAPQVKPDGTRVRGGPMLSGKLPEQVPAMCDLVLRCGWEPTAKPWPGVFRCSLDPNWVMKDRYSVVADPAPMNLGELLRAAGYAISRHPQLPWQEDAVAALAAQFEGVEPGALPAAANAAYAKLAAVVPPPFARATVVDAVDRATIRRASAARAATFF